MINEHMNFMRQAAQMATQGEATTRIGIVTGYDPNTYSAKVQIQPEGLETGWIPVTSSWVGNGWGMFCPPSLGDAVKVEFQGGSFESGMTDARLFNNVDRPLTVPSGEFWLVHKSGSFVKLLNDGTIVSNAPAWNHTGDHNVDGSVSTTGNLSAGTGATGTFTTEDGQTVLVQDGIVISIG